MFLLFFSCRNDVEKCSCYSNQYVLCYYNRSIQHLLFSMECKIPEIPSKQRNAEIAHDKYLRFTLYCITCGFLLPWYQSRVCSRRVRLDGLHRGEAAVKSLAWTHESAVIHPDTMCWGGSWVKYGWSRASHCKANAELQVYFVRLSYDFISQFWILCATFQGHLGVHASNGFAQMSLGHLHRACS